MSRYEYETGTLLLPAAAVTTIKKAVRDAANRHHDQVYAEVTRWWDANKPRTWETYRAATYATPAPLGLEDSSFVLQHLEHLRERDGKGPRKPTRADVAAIVPRYTNRDDTFQADEAAVSFDGRELRWDVPDNNHAVEHAREHPVGKALFAALDRVTWTRDTGGYFVGNNEYNRDDDSLGGGGNYLTASFGPRGERVGRAYVY